MKEIFLTGLLLGSMHCNCNANSATNYPLDPEINYPKNVKDVKFKYNNTTIEFTTPANMSLNNYAATGGVVGAYGGVAWGTRGLLKNAPYGNAYDKSSSGIMGGVTVGYDVAVSDYVSLGLESGLQHNYKISESHHGEKLSVFSIPTTITSKFFIPNTDGLHFIGKTGFAWNQLIIDEPNNREKDNSIGPLIAAGIGYKIVDFAFSVQWQHNWMTYRSKENNYAHVSLGITYVIQ